MSFSLYKQPVNSIDLKIDNSSPLPALHRYFTLTPVNQNSNDETATFTGIAEDAPGLSYSTTWEDGPTTVFAKKINDLTDNDFIKAFATKDENYQPVIATDSWTQQYPKAGIFLSVPLKFRTYLDNMLNTTSYRTWLPMLFKWTTPKSYEFMDGITNLRRAVNSAKNIGTDFGLIIKDTNQAMQYLIKHQKLNGDVIKWGELVDAIVGTRNELPAASADEIYSAITNKMSVNNKLDEDTNKNVRTVIEGVSALVALLNTITAASSPGCMTFKLEYGKIYKPVYDQWVISSWGFTPSMNTTYNNKPLYVDINITLRTADIIGTEDMSKIIY